MKTLLKLLFFVACIGLFAGCEKEEDFYSGENFAELKSIKITVRPSTASDVFVKAQEDWDNINEALQNAKEGDVVQLAEGLFYLHKSIIRWDFNGELRGSGIDKTTIQTVPGELFDVSDCPLLEWSWQTKEGHSMICFPHNSNNEKRTVVVSDLTIIGSEPATEWLAGSVPKNDLQAIIVYYKNLIGSGYLGDPTLSDQINLNVLYKNISVIGDEDPTKYMGHRFSIGIGLAAFGASSGNFEAKNISMANVEYCITTHAFCGQSSTVSIKNVRIKNANTGIYSWTNNFWEIKDSEFIDCSVNAIELNTYNQLFTTPFKGAVIKDNHFSMSNSQWNGISGVRMNNVQVRDNSFSGNCFTGIFAGRGDSWEIKDNDFCKLNVTNPEGATIILHNTLNSIVGDNSNQVVLGTSAGDPSNYIGEEVNCDDDD